MPSAGTGMPAAKAASPRELVAGRGPPAGPGEDGGDTAPSAMLPGALVYSKSALYTLSRESLSCSLRGTQPEKWQLQKQR